MSDLTIRLEGVAGTLGCEGRSASCDVVRQAVETINTLQARNAELEEVVEAVAQFGYWVHWDCPVQSHIDKARELCNSKAKQPAKEQG
jgi:hypothetical protein